MSPAYPPAMDSQAVEGALKRILPESEFLKLKAIEEKSRTLIRAMQARYHHDDTSELATYKIITAFEALSKLTP